MSTSFQPRSRWASGTNQNSIPANDNTLRTELMERPWLGVANSPPTSNDYDVYVVGDTPSGDFATFDENDVAIYLSGDWKAWAPFEGMRGVIDDVRMMFDGASWVEDPSAGGGGGGGGSSPVSTISGTTYTVIASDEGQYLRFTNGSAKSATVDPESTTPLPDDGEWYFRNHGANDLTLIEGSGVTINPPAGGTLVVPSGGTVVLKRVAADEFDLSGQVSP